MEIETTQLELPGEGSPMPAQFCKPTAPGSYPGVLVIMEGSGITDQIRDVARRVAAEGYLTIAPDFYYRAGDMELPEDHLQRAFALISHIWDARLAADMRVAVNHMKAHGATKFGSMGFCWGGRAAFLAAAFDNDIAAAVSFYGQLAGGKPTLKAPVSLVDLAPAIKGSILAFFGDQDQFVPVAVSKDIEKALSEAEVDHEVVVYKGAGHGFFRDGTDDYRPEAAADAWEKTKALFKKRLS